MKKKVTYFVFKDMFMFNGVGIISLEAEEIISIQQIGDEDEEGVTCFHWMDNDGKKEVGVLFDVVAFDNIEDASAWVLADLPSFIDMVNEDKAKALMAIEEMDEVLVAAQAQVVDAHAAINSKKKAATLKKSDGKKKKGKK